MVETPRGCSYIRYSCARPDDEIGRRDSFMVNLFSIFSLTNFAAFSLPELKLFISYFLNSNLHGQECIIIAKRSVIVNLFGYG